MRMHWGYPVLAIVLVASLSASAAHLGTTNYAGSACPTCSEQTHFPAACAIVDPVPVTPASFRVTSTAACPPSAATPPCAKPDQRLVFDVQYRTVTGTVYKPVTETVMKDIRTTVSEPVTETRFRECAVTTRRNVCRTVTTHEYFYVWKPVSETTVQEIRKPVNHSTTETHYRDCEQTVCKPVTETVYREVARTVCRDVTEVRNREVCREVCEAQTMTRPVCKTIPETVTETIPVPARLVLRRVPRYECAFDPCTGTNTQTQAGTTLKFVREPAHTVSRQVTRNRTVVAQETYAIPVRRTVIDTVPEVVTKTLKSVVIEKVPETITRNILTKVAVKVPDTTTRTTQTIEVQKTPVTVTRNAMGAYVEVAALKKEVAAKAHGAAIIVGGTAVLARGPDTPMFEAAAPGRIFVEGLKVVRPITSVIHQTVPMTEIRREPFTVTKTVTREVVKQVPTEVTRVVPTTVTVTVPVRVCRLACGDAAKKAPAAVNTLCPPVVTNCAAPAAPSCRCNAKPPATGLFSRLREKMHSSCRSHPLRDFFARLHGNRLSCLGRLGPCCAATLPAIK